MLRDNGINFSRKDTAGKTPTMLAIKNNTVEVFQFLVECGSEITSKECDKTTALHKVVQHGSTTLLRKLLSIGAKVNLKNKDGQTPLHRACQSGNSDMVQELMQNNCDVLSQDKKGQTALHVAAKYDNAGCANMLVTSCAGKTNKKMLNMTDKEGRTPLTTSFMYDSSNVTSLVVAAMKKFRLFTNSNSILQNAFAFGVEYALLDDIERQCPAAKSIEEIAKLNRLVSVHFRFAHQSIKFYIDVVHHCTRFHNLIQKKSFVHKKVSIVTK